MPTRRYPYFFFAGAAAAWVDTVQKFGNGKLTIAEVLEPAIRLAEDGYVARFARKKSDLTIIQHTCFRNQQHSCMSLHFTVILLL